MSWADRKKPYVIGMLTGAVVLGSGLGYYFFTDWEVARRLIAGGVFGLWCAMLVLAGRLYL